MIARLALGSRTLAKLLTGSITLVLTLGTALPAVAQDSSTKTTNCPVQVLSQPIYWNLERLGKVKSQIQTETSPYKVAYERLMRDADEALGKDLYSVTHKTKPGPSGDPKDYVSLSRYFWPNPKKKNGLPYIRKDGQTNPEINGEGFDRRRSQRMTDDVTTLSLAAYFTGNKTYSDKAKRIVQTWFLDETTAMNPHLNFAQSVPGASQGREFGILDGRIYWDVIDSLLLLQSANMVEAEFVDDLRGWFGTYAAWLIRSDFGKKARARKNNHGTYYDAQLAHVLMFAGRCDIAAKVVQTSHARTISQIDKTGLMPEEASRTQSLFYHAFNLRAYLRLSYFARRLDIDYYDKATSGSGSVKASVDFVASYAGRVDEWPYKEINKSIDKALWNMLIRAQWFDDGQTMSEAISKLNYGDTQNRMYLIFGD